MQKVKLANRALLEAMYFIAKRAKTFEPDVIVAIERGGLPLGIYLSAYLNVPLERIKVSFYDDTVKRDTPKVDLKNFDINDYKKPLFVDDLVDTGDTMQYIKETYGDVPYVTIYGSTTCTPDLFYFTKPADQWIIFPWDKEDDGFDYKFMEQDWWKRLEA